MKVLFEENKYWQRVGGAVDKFQVEIIEALR